MYKITGGALQLGFKTVVYVLFFLLLTSTCLGSEEEIFIPLTVHEALRIGVEGMERFKEPVTVGIPFPRGILHERDGVPQLALVGVEEYQFRTLARWSDGSVRWALVDFQANCQAGGINKDIKIIKGEGNSSGRYLASERDDRIFIDTGIMQVQIRKKGFNMFDRVVVKDREIISEGSSRGVVIAGGDGKEYSSSSDLRSKVVIEENGPVRAVVKAKGSLQAGQGQILDYTMRMHFYRNKSRVRVFYTLQNARKRQINHVFINSIDLSLRLNLSGELKAEIATHNGVIKELLPRADKDIVFYQAVSDFPQVYSGGFYWHAPIPADSKREKQRGFKQEGYWIWKGGKELIHGQRGEFPDLAYIAFSDKRGRGVTFGIRFAAGLWPKSLRARGDGTIEVGLWPKENQAGYWIRYGSHNTFEVMYEFHPQPNEPLVSMKRFQYPLVAKAPVWWYNRNVEGIYPLYHFVSFKEERQYIKRKGWRYAKKIENRRRRMIIWRYHYWGEGGFLNQHDFARISLVNFLRETEDPVRAGEYYLYAEERFNYNADWAVFHSDDYDLSTFKKGKWTPPTPKKHNKKASLAKVVFEWEHPHWYGLPLYYYITGDERIREAVMDWAEYVKKTHTNITMGAYGRVWGWGMYTLSAMYDFTGDPVFMQIADENFEWLLKNKRASSKNRRVLFIDWQRGYVSNNNKKLKPGLTTGYTIFDGLYNYYLHMDEKHPLREKVEDVLEGLSDFMYREPYFEEKNGSFWLPYKYNLQDKTKSHHGYRLVLQALYVNLAPYLVHGGHQWLERMDKIIKAAALRGMEGGFSYLDHPGLQAILYQRLHPRVDNKPPQAVNDLSAKVKGEEIILNWTAPEDAVKYQIKYSKKKLVESLGFDPKSRTYNYDPQEYTNWWAGENVPDEPKPGKPGTLESYIIKGLKPGKYYFAIRSWDAFNNRSRISNLAEVTIK